MCQALWRRIRKLCVKFFTRNQETTRKSWFTGFLVFWFSGFLVSWFPGLLVSAGNLEARNLSGSQKTIGKPWDQEITKPGNQETRKTRNQEIGKPRIQETRKPFGNQDTMSKPSGNQETTRKPSGNQETRKPGNQKPSGNHQEAIRKPRNHGEIISLWFLGFPGFLIG